MIFGYFSPEVTFPLASVLAASIGFIVLVGRAPIRAAKTAFRYVTRPFRRASTPVRSNGEKLDV